MGGNRLRRQALREACQVHPALAIKVLDWLGNRIYQRNNEVDWLTSSSAPQRLGSYLLSLPSSGGCIRLPLTQQQLAGRLGIRPETLSRLFSEWQRRGYLSGRQRNWVLTDQVFLHALSRGAQRPF